LIIYFAAIDFRHAIATPPLLFFRCCQLPPIFSPAAAADAAFRCLPFHFRRQMPPLSHFHAAAAACRRFSRYADDDLLPSPPP